MVEPQLLCEILFVGGWKGFVVLVVKHQLELRKHFNDRLFDLIQMRAINRVRRPSFDRCVGG